MLRVDFHPSRETLAQFGWISLIGFPLVGAVFTFGFGAAPTVLWVLAAVGVLTFVASRIEPRFVAPIYVGLMLVTLPIGIVVSTVMMALIFYGMFLPTGVLFRLFGKDRITKRPDPELPTYWHERGAPRAATSYYRLY